MTIEVIVTEDFRHMTKVAADMVNADIISGLEKKKEFVLGLPTGGSPKGLYKLMADSANAGEWDSSRVRSFNLDEYVGLPGRNAQECMMHHESYCFFMIQEFFGLLKRKFAEWNLPCGSLINQEMLDEELEAHRDDWRRLGRDAGKWIKINARPVSEYLAWIRSEILDTYARDIRRAGGIDLQIIGVGGRGHVAFHEAGIPFKGSQVMLVELDDNTVSNAVADGHFPSREASPRYAITMGAELIYQARKVVLLASGERKSLPVAKSLLEDPVSDIPVSYGQVYARNGGSLVYVVDTSAGRELLANRKTLKEKGIMIRRSR